MITSSSHGRCSSGVTSLQEGPVVLDIGVRHREVGMGPVHPLTELLGLRRLDGREAFDALARTEAEPTSSRSTADQDGHGDSGHAVALPPGARARFGLSTPEAAAAKAQEPRQPRVARGPRSPVPSGPLPVAWIDLLADIIVEDLLGAEAAACPSAVPSTRDTPQLVEAVNGRLRARQPGLTGERERLQRELRDVQERFRAVRRFVEEGDGSAKVREWLADLEREETRLEGALQALEAEAARPLLQVHPGKVAAYLANLRATLAKGGMRARAVVHEDVERVVIHSARSETAKPFARAEVIASGKGLLSGVVLVVAGGEALATVCKPLDFRWEVTV
jgi:hypothetical protein